MPPRRSPPQWPWVDQLNGYPFCYDVSAIGGTGVREPETGRPEALLRALAPGDAAAASSGPQENRPASEARRAIDLMHG